MTTPRPMLVPEPDWLDGQPMDPAAEPPEALDTLPGFPFLHEGMAAVVVGPTGGGRSSLVIACAYDAARAGLRVAYLGSEITPAELNSRAADLADKRGDTIDDTLRAQLASVRYLDLADVMLRAKDDERHWVGEVAERFDVVIVDPLSAVASALGLDFDRSNQEYVQWYDHIVEPLRSTGTAVVLLENVGHSEDARARAKGASAKNDKADLTFHCRIVKEPEVGLLITAQKVRSVRAAFRRGDTWMFDEHHRRVVAQDQGERRAFRPTVLMERISRALETEPGLTRNDIVRSSDHVAGNKAGKVAALQVLIDEGYVRVTAGERNTTHHHNVRPYRQQEDDGQAEVDEDGYQTWDFTS